MRSLQAGGVILALTGFLLRFIGMMNSEL